MTDDGCAKNMSNLGAVYTSQVNPAERGSRDCLGAHCGFKARIN